MLLANEAFPCEATHGRRVPSPSRSTMNAFLSALLFCLLAVLPASAATDIFIRAKGPMPGSMIYTGDSLAEEYPGSQGWFQLESLSFGIENTVTIGSTSGGAGAGKARALPVSALKFPNSASAALFTACAMGGHWDEFEIVFAKPSQLGQVATMKVDFKLVFVTSVGVSGAAADDQARETVALTYGAHRITFFGTDKGGKPVQTGQTIWSFVLNQDVYAVQ